MYDSHSTFHISTWCLANKSVTKAVLFSQLGALQSSDSYYDSEAYSASHKGSAINSLQAAELHAGAHNTCLPLWSQESGNSEQFNDTGFEVWTSAVTDLKKRVNVKSLTYNYQTKNGCCNRLETYMQCRLVYVQSVFADSFTCFFWRRVLRCNY